MDSPTSHHWHTRSEHLQQLPARVPDQPSFPKVCRWHGHSPATNLEALIDRVLQRHPQPAPTCSPQVLDSVPLTYFRLLYKRYHLQAPCVQPHHSHMCAWPGCFVCTLRAPARNLLSFTLPRSLGLPSYVLLICFDTVLLSMNLNRHSPKAISSTILDSQMPFLSPC